MSPARTARAGPRRDDDGVSTLVLRVRADRVNDPLLDAAAAAMSDAVGDAVTVEGLRHGPVSVAKLEQDATSHGADGLLTIHNVLGVLADAGVVTFASGPGADCLAELRPMAPGFRLMPVGGTPLALSRFAYLHRVGDSLVCRTPLGVGSIRLTHPDSVRLFAALTEGTDVHALRALTGQPPGEVIGFCELLVAGAVAGPATADGAAVGDLTPALQQWEFHDLLFHGATRLGRHDAPMGGTFRFAGSLPPTPALPDRPWPTTIRLPLPADAARPRLDTGLVDVMARRRSVREQGSVPISLRELGEVLAYAARVLEIRPGPVGPLAWRPYPSGGASYELEIFLTVDRCMGLLPGFYYYDAARHGLAPISPPTADTTAMVDLAHLSSGQVCRPQILLTIASRFPRVSWKYAGIAYATTLKNLGALYATLYLAATAMGLAPCALGLGDAERFSRITGLDRCTEPSIGEFMLGSRD